MNIDKEFAPYQESLELKELGFDEPTSFYWENNVIRPLPMKDEVGAFHFNRHTRTENEWICAPTFSQAFRWFRKKYELPSWIYTSNNKEFWYSILKEGRMMVRDYKPFNTHEEAELACLRKLIEIVKEKS